MQASSGVVLRISFDLSQSVDSEVYNILRAFSAIECKNFLLSACLYYSRSPLVASADRLVLQLDRLTDSIAKVGGFSFDELRAGIRDDLGGLLSGLSSVHGQAGSAGGPASASVSEVSQLRDMLVSFRL